MSCQHDPRELKGQPIGMYHCPECGMMVIAGLAHPSEDKEAEMPEPIGKTTYTESDPVNHDEDGWYYYIETWSDRVGPFETEAKARAALEEYAKSL